MKHIKEISIKLTVLPIFCLMLLSVGCTSSFMQGTQAVTVSGRRVIHEEEFGGIYIDLTIDEFMSLGFDYGDSVSINFSNGFKLTDIPYYNGYYEKPGEMLLVGYSGYPYIEAAVQGGDPLWDIADMHDGDTADITLVKKGEYLKVQEARDLSYSDERNDYLSDEIFANFRSVKTSNIGSDTLYRSASPCDNKRNRAGYVDRLAKGAGIGFILDLADSDALIQAYMEKDDFDSGYFKFLYEKGDVAPIAMDMAFGSEATRKKLVEGLNAMAEHDGPYLIHCTEGKDRTGFVCMLLEALCGASYDELLNDYLITYDNYYGITKDSDPDKYDIIVSDIFEQRLAMIADDDGIDLKTADLGAYAEKYLESGGMTKDEITALKSKLAGTP
ncbi:MAG: tyrosine-protein phosphatase [Lachnospiraceae bacterium]|nr:tyrosine-protein phosphatase [Lachnospiraceae bacterium]